jgi:hypothetical protein
VVARLDLGNLQTDTRLHDDQPCHASFWIASRTGVRPWPERSISCFSLTSAPGWQCQRHDRMFQCQIGKVAL